MQPKYQAMDIPGNDSKHNFADPNGGGGPRQLQKRIPPNQKGGFGHNGRDIVAQRASMGGGRSGSGNPASRAGSVGSFQPDASISGHGGSPQTRGGAGTGRNFGNSGQSGVPTGPASNPQPGAGNTSGKSYRMIAGRFKRAAMGAKGNQGSSGSYGGSPVTTNT